MPIWTTVEKKPMPLPRSLTVGACRKTGTMRPSRPLRREASFWWLMVYALIIAVAFVVMVVRGDGL